MISNNIFNSDIFSGQQLYIKSGIAANSEGIKFLDSSDTTFMHLTDGGDVSVKNSINIEGNTSINNALGVGGNLTVTGDTTTEGNISVTNSMGIGGNLLVTGDMTINGTTTTINSTTLQVDDKNIEMGVVDSPTDSTADGGGITLKGDTDKTIAWSNSTDNWESSEHFSVADGKYFKSDKLRARDGDGLYLVDDADNGIFVKDGGNVGIGTTDPGSKLEIVDTSNHLNLEVPDTSSQSVIKFSDSDGLAGAINYDHNTDKLHFITDGTATPSNGALTILTGGNVGIGTTSPLSKTNIDNGHLLISQSANTTQENILLQGAGYYIGSTLYGNVSIRSNYNNSTNAGTLNFYTATSSSSTAERMRIDEDGNVGIGTTNPDCDLTIQGRDSSNGGEVKLCLTSQDGSQNGAFAHVDEAGAERISIRVGGHSSSVEKMAILNNGKVGIGTTTPTGNLTLMGDFQLSRIAAPSTTTDKLYNVGGNLTWNGITLGANDSNKTDGFTLNQDAETSSAVQFARIGVNVAPSGTAGTIIATNDIVAFTSSDERLKDNVTLLSDPIDKISQIKGVNFVWNDESYDHLAGHDIGVLAQDVEKVLPEVVATRDDGYKAVRYEKMVPLLIEAIKDQQQQITDLKSRLDEAGL